MITGIVELPPTRPQGPSKFVSSETCLFAPDSQLCYELGYEDIWRDVAFQAGSYFRLRQMRRFKLLEYDREHIYEHFAVSHPEKEKTYCILWTTTVDKRTLKTSKLLNTNGIWEVYRCLNGTGLMADLGAAAELLTARNAWIDQQQCLERLAAITRGMVPLSKEDEMVREMFKISMNLSTLNDESVYPTTEKVFSGVNPDVKNPVKMTASEMLAGRSEFTFKDLKPVLHPMCNRNDLRYMLSPEENKGDSRNGLSEEGLWFDVLKYVEAIPYGEFFVGDKHKVGDKIVVVNPYDRPFNKEVVIDDNSPEVKLAIERLDELLCHLTCQGKWQLFRSWNEDVYITITSSSYSFGSTWAGRRSTRYYFDMTYAALGTRMISDSFNC